MRIMEQERACADAVALGGMCARMVGEEFELAPPILAGPDAMLIEAIARLCRQQVTDKLCATP